MISNFLISRLAAFSPTPYPKFNFTVSVLQHSAFHSFKPKSSQHEKGDKFTVSYLTTSCGLSPEIAARVSQKVTLTTPDKPNAVLAFLKNHGLSEAQIAKYVQKRPLVLHCDPEKTLLPKFKFLKSIGFSDTDLNKLVVNGTSILKRSLEKCLIPRYKVLRSVVRNDEEVVRALKQGAVSFIYHDVMSNLVPNMNFLRECGVRQASISHIVMFHPNAAFMKHSRFVEAVELVKKMGFDSSKISFVSAVHVLIHSNKEKWELRLKAFKKFGWSQETSLLAFRRYPVIMLYTEQRIEKSMNFLVKVMGWSSEDIARFPAALSYSLEKRIMPRCQVIKILKSKGLVKDHLKLSSFVCITEETFLKTFVTKFLKDVPVLLDVYRGFIDHGEGWELRLEDELST